MNNHIRIYEKGTKFLIVLSFLFGGFLNFQAARAATFVSGVISADTTWTKTESPYVVGNYFEVGEDATLTIEPGTIVKFNRSRVGV